MSRSAALQWTSPGTQASEHGGRPWGLCPGSCWPPHVHALAGLHSICVNTRTFPARESPVWERRRGAGSLLIPVTSPGAPGLGSQRSAGARGRVCEASCWKLPLKALLGCSEIWGKGKYSLAKEFPGASTWPARPFFPKFL